MNDPVIRCPSCRKEIKLTESLAAPLVERARAEYEQEARARQAELVRREDLLREQKTRLDEDRRALDETVADRIDRERDAIAKAEAKRARELLKLDLETKQRELMDLKAVIDDRDKKLAAAYAAQVELERKKRELDDAKREFELTIEKRINSGLAGEREKARRQADEQGRLTLAERDLQIKELRAQIDELKLKAEEGSQRIHGEVQEMDLERSLQEHFPDDDIAPIAKGQRGADVLHRVVSAQGAAAGSILWESKRTKHFQRGWLVKLRDDQREAKADVGILVTHALPDGAGPIELDEGIWIAHASAAIPVAVAVRQLLIEVASTRQAQRGQQSKTALVYEYFTGPQFKQRVEALIEAYGQMQSDLNRERRVFTTAWNKRQAQLDQLLRATTGMWGDLQGIAGRSLKEIPALDMKALAAGGGDGGDEG